MVALGLFLRAWAFSRFRERRLLSSGAWASHGGGFCCGAQGLDSVFNVCSTWLSSFSVQALGRAGLSNCSTRAQELRLADPRALTQYLWHMDAAVPRPEEYSQARDATLVPCVVRQIRTHCATKVNSSWPRGLQHARLRSFTLSQSSLRLLS